MPACSPRLLETGSMAHKCTGGRRRGAPGGPCSLFYFSDPKLVNTPLVSSLSISAEQLEKHVLTLRTINPSISKDEALKLFASVE